MHTDEATCQKKEVSAENGMYLVGLITMGLLLPFCPPFHWQTAER